MKSILPIVSATTLTLASSITNADSDDSDLQLLKQQLRALQERVEVLEAIKPTFTSMMPNFAERFHVMHRAGDAGDWAIAGHELQELKRLTNIADKIDPKNGQLMQDMMKSSFELLESAIAHGNSKKFQVALNQTTDVCNACHQAAGSPFIQVTLNEEESISLRHPHALKKSEKVGGHTH